jgi:NAD(P)H-hydrate epimerase
MSLEQPDNRFLWLTTREQSRTLDQSTIEEFGIDSITLMEIAGKQAADFIHGTIGNRASGVYLCGKGNNAGDALVAARYLSETAGHAISLLFVAGTDDFSDDAQRNYDLLKKLADNGSDITFLTDVNSADIEWHSFDYAVDGMIGTGLSSDLREPMADLVDELNVYDLPVFSMDIPTGLNCNTGDILGTCVEADHTITFGTNKIGFYLGDGPTVTGSIKLAELPFPNYLREHAAILVNKSLREEFDEQKNTATHKYARGTVHIVAGSEGMTGAAIMAAKSAWGAGAGAVILYAPKGLLPIYEQVLPEIIKIPVGNSDDVHFTNRHAAQILEKIYEKEGVLLIGPGLGLASSTEKCVLKLLKTVEQPIILDADGLSAWKECGNLDKSNWLLTPHPGELEKYLNIPICSDADRLSSIKAFTKKESCRLLSKGYPTMLSTHDGDTFITGYDTRMFARAGFGDVLAGTIAGKMAVSKQFNRSITDALVSNLEKAESVNEPQPSDIYDR